MSEDTLPEPDRVEGAPHPRETEVLYGQTAAEAEFLTAFNAGKTHHAWLLHGTQGIGKATLAWRIARFLLNQPREAGDCPFAKPELPQTLEADPTHPAVRRARTLGEPRLALVRRGWNEKTKHLQNVITIYEVRKLKSFFALSIPDGGWRVAIVDAADEMNTSAANAMLKILEEPPEKTVLLLIAHQPARLLPTIRSRCRGLRCAPLSSADVAAALVQAGHPAGEDAAAIAELSAGSAGSALRLIRDDGVAIYAQLLGLLTSAPGIDRGAVLNLADGCTGTANAGHYGLILSLITLLLTRLARYAAAQPAIWTEAVPDEARAFARLGPSPGHGRQWAELTAGLSARIGHAKEVNIDPAGVVLDALLAIDAHAKQVV
ncbi:MAG: DNA polymerase III subunit delta' [Rhodobacteraceae bacterium]|nr:DNA polymerase III subunit delta' [Paracoccaceae bacterium]